MANHPIRWVTGSPSSHVKWVTGSAIAQWVNYPNPDWVAAVAAPRRRVPVARRRTSPSPVPTQAAAASPTLVARAHRVPRRLQVMARGRRAIPVPAQLNPPIVTQPARAPRRMGRPSKGREAHTPLAQAAPVNPAFVTNALAKVARIRPLRRGREAIPVPAQLNPPIVTQPSRAQRRLGRAARGRPSIPVQPQDSLPARLQPKPRAPKRRVNTVPAPPLTQSAAPANPSFVSSALAKVVRNRPTRRGREAVVVPAQVNPPIVVQPSRSPRRLGRMARGRRAIPVPAQLNPPIVTQPARAPRRLVRTAKGREVHTPLTQTATPTNPAFAVNALAKVVRNRPTRRGRPAVAVPAQLNPPIVTQPARSPRRLRALPVKGKRAVPVPRQENPPIVTQPDRSPRRIQIPVRRGRRAIPVPAQLNPPIVTQPSRTARRLPLLGAHASTRRRLIGWIETTVLQTLITGRTRTSIHSSSLTETTVDMTGNAFTVVLHDGDSETRIDG